MTTPAAPRPVSNTNPNADGLDEFWTEGPEPEFEPDLHTSLAEVKRLAKQDRKERKIARNK